MIKIRLANFAGPILTGGENMNHTKNQDIVLIAAVSRNNVIGIDGKIPWDLPEDRKRFSNLTKGYPIIMGRVTYGTLPPKFRPLPGRQNFVLTSDQSFCEDGVYAARSLEKALHDLGDRRLHVDGIDYSKIFIGGGQKVYEAAMEHATMLEITHVDQYVDGSELRYFPKIDRARWKEKELLDREGYSFVTYVRR